MNFYIHVPFCLSKCNYCGFYSRACGALNSPPAGESAALPSVGGIWNNYLAGILSEIEYWGKRRNPGPAKTIFFGGGTPSLMPPEIFNQIVDALNPAPDCEITMEANPGTVKNLEKYKINRLSIGVQSLCDDELKFLGRKHTVADSLRLIRDAQSLDLRVSADFIYGLPDSKVADIKKLCEQINELGLEHCSMYELSIEPGTPFSKMNLQMPNNETMAQMYETIGATLNLPRYEVSNYGVPCRHNMNVWDGEEYIGLGDGAAGRVIVDDEWLELFPFAGEGVAAGDDRTSPHDQVRPADGVVEKNDLLTTTPSVPKTILQDEILCRAPTPLRQRRGITIKERAIEKIITGLRTTRGVRLTDDIRTVIDWEYVEKNKELFNVTDRIALKNFLLLDTIMVGLIK